MLTCPNDAMGRLNSKAVRTKTCKTRLAFIYVPCQLPSFSWLPSAGFEERSACSVLWASHPQTVVTLSFGRCCGGIGCISGRELPGVRQGTVITRVLFISYRIDGTRKSSLLTK